MGLTSYDDLARAQPVRQRSAIALVALAAMFVIGSTEIDAQRRAPKARTLSMSATAYCQHGETKSGTQTTSGVVAADPRVLPMGTTIRVTGLLSPRPQTFIVADTGAAVKGNELDIFMSDCARAKIFGRRQVLVRVLKRPSPGTRAPDDDDVRALPTASSSS
jgi:3D (Asp-Asp-Asp) domain-containing protein